MKRNIILIDEDKCTGCGLCVSACHEGALQLIDGKAKLISESYCDGLGACLPECPTNAIRIEEREAAEFDEAAVKAKEAADLVKKMNKHAGQHQPCACPSTHAKSFDRNAGAKAATENANSSSTQPQVKAQSELRQWPCQIQLVPANAPYFDDADLLIAADCTAYAFAGFHDKFMKGKISLIGCPKLDDTDYAEKLTAILIGNDIRSLTVVRMEVPCCGGIVNSVKEALKESGKIIPWQVITISTDGEIL